MDTVAGTLKDIENAVAAAEQGNLQVLCSLGSRGVDLGLCYKDGVTLMEAALRKRSYNAVRYLWYYGVEINTIYSRSKSGLTPMHYAILHNDIDQAVWMCYNGGDLEIPAVSPPTSADLPIRDGQTPFMCAVEKFTKADVRWLLSAHRRHQLNNSSAFRSLGAWFSVLCLAVVGDIVLNTGVLTQPVDYTLSMESESTVTAFVVHHRMMMLCLLGPTWGLAWMHFLAVVSGPGSVRADFHSGSPREFCPSCKVFRGDAARHCHYCGTCVPRMQTHCSVSKCCIGERNFGAFLLWLGLVTLWTTVAAVVLWSRGWYIAALINVGVGCAAARALIAHVAAERQGLTLNQLQNQHLPSPGSALNV
eukprot:m.391857 g.391857  ORF g.391857 m.391857 type:complete len:362 (+) comp21077_c0_seq3:82-1167(+)